MLAASPTVRITEKPVDSGYPADARAFEIEGADFAAVARGFAAHQIIASPSSAAAIARRWLMPSENLPAFVFFTLARPVRSMTVNDAPHGTTRAC